MADFIGGLLQLVQDVSETISHSQRDRLHGVFSDHPDRLKTSNVLAVYTATVL
ncbi:MULTISPECIES: hypothetical protein [unclassified Coleofasciculus]|uniref:hypothetical protein n=1 Tax=unclassified Coleofasciculus TaxID=2692782 RepID=UPI001683590B|nr:MULTISPECIES: hypothetical protein [unclassified Coleofasciculus]MBD1881339.1 hypothetical protein [Coleofasciculus sp. FACHB-T130]MBD1944163.1 hypothetical protein [Coleofasciculus sp. FACHB-712]